MKKFKLFSYNPPAKGVAKDDERASVQTDFPGFFVMYGRKFWNISNLNLLMAVYVLLVLLGVWALSPYPIPFYIYLAFCALLFGIVSTGTTYVTRGYVRGDPVYILSDFWYAVKHNWKQGLALGLVDLAVIFLLIFDIFFWASPPTRVSEYTSGVLDSAVQAADRLLPEHTASPADEETALPSSEENASAPVLSETDASAAKTETSFWDGIFFYTCIFLLILYSFMRCYMYLILVTFKLSIFKVLKNSFIFAILGIKRNLLAFLGIGLLCFINLWIFVYVPIIGIMLPLIITLASTTFIGAYAAYPVIKKYMITPYYEDEEVYGEYDKIFEDRG